MTDKIRPALARYKELGGADEPSPIERLRFFCSLAMDGQDWLDVEPFFDAVQKEIDNLQAKLDAIMLEYCPEYMEDTQLFEWERNQRPVEPEEVYSPHTEVLK